MSHEQRKGRQSPGTAVHKHEGYESDWILTILSFEPGVKTRRQVLCRGFGCGRGRTVGWREDNWRYRRGRRFTKAMQFTRRKRPTRAEQILDEVGRQKSGA